jgi:ParB/RepB/Spo0J family partition protein
MGTPSEEVKEIPVEILAPDPMNVRGSPDIDEKFRKSIEGRVIEPLIIRPVCLLGQEKIREELRSKNKQFVVTIGVRRFEAAHQARLKTVPCIIREFDDFEAMCLSITENRHRKEISPWKMVEVVFVLYRKLEGTKTERVKKMAEMTGISKTAIFDYLNISKLPPDFIARLKEPEECSFSEKEPLAETSARRSETTNALPRVSVNVMKVLARDKNFRRLTKKNPAKAHEIATEATGYKTTVLRQDHVERVLQSIQEHMEGVAEER